MNGRNRTSDQRQRLAYEAARIMAEQGVVEFDRARRKAAERTGIGDRRCWPNNEEIHEALLAHRRLFEEDRRGSELAALRQQALAAMRALAPFDPRLVGPVLTGSGDASHRVRLHLHADAPEDVVHFLIDQGIPWQQREVWVRYAGGLRRQHPALAFFAGNTPFDLIVLPRDARRNPPLDPVSERPEKGADVLWLERLLAREGGADGR